MLSYVLLVFQCCCLGIKLGRRVQTGQTDRGRRRQLWPIGRTMGRADLATVLCLALHYNPIIHTMPYDRHVVVSCIERHYDLLVRMAYLDPDTILRPPPEGWTDE